MTMFEIEKQGVSTHLTYLIRDNDNIDDLSLGMLTNNRIKGVSPIVYTQLNENRYFKFDISSKAPASKLFSGTVTRNTLLTFISGILTAVMAAEEYMVDASLFVFDLDYIFVDVSTYQPFLICLPVLDRAQSNGHVVDRFIKELIFKAQFDQTENGDYVARIINYLNSTPVFSIADFKKMIDAMKTATVQAPPASPPNPNKEQSAVPVAPPQKPTRPERSEPNRERTSSNSTDFRGGVASTSQQRRQEKPINVPFPESSPNNETKNEGSSHSSTPVVSGENQTSGKKMSFIYLIRHYNKENLEAYKAQKDSSGAETVSVPGKKEKPSKKRKGNEASHKSMDSFAMPGKEVFIKPNVTPKDSTLNPGPTTNSAVSTQGVPLGGYAQSTSVQTQAANFGETTVLGSATAAGETSLLGGANVRRHAFLVRARTGEKVMIDKPRFRIGKERSYVDYFISDNTAISRAHADIIEKNGSYFIVDQNSTNGTFVNGNRAPAQTEVVISNGNKIRLANEEFDFVEEL